MKEKLWFVLTVYIMAVLFACSTIHINTGEGRVGHRTDAELDSDIDVEIGNEL